MLSFTFITGTRFSSAVLSVVVHFLHLQESNIPTMSLTISALLFYSSVVVIFLT